MLLMFRSYHCHIHFNHFSYHSHTNIYKYINLYIYIYIWCIIHPHSFYLLFCKRSLRKFMKCIHLKSIDTQNTIITPYHIHLYNDNKHFYSLFTDTTVELLAKYIYIYIFPFIVFDYKINVIRFNSDHPITKLCQRFVKVFLHFEQLFSNQN